MLSYTIFRFYILWGKHQQNSTPKFRCVPRYVNDNKGFPILKTGIKPTTSSWQPDLYTSRILLNLRKRPVRLVLRKTPALLHFHHACTFERRLFELRRVDVLLKGAPLSFLISCCSLLASNTIGGREKKDLCIFDGFLCGQQNGSYFYSFKKKKKKYIHQCQANRWPQATSQHISKIWLSAWFCPNFSIFVKSETLMF